MIDSSYLLPFVGVFVLALILDYWLTFGLRIWQKKRDGEVTLSTADQIKQIWQRARALKSDLSTRWVSLKQPRCLKLYSLFGGTILIAAGLFLFSGETNLGAGWGALVLAFFFKHLPLPASREG